MAHVEILILWLESLKLAPSAPQRGPLLLSAGSLLRLD